MKLKEIPNLMLPLIKDVRYDRGSNSQGFKEGFNDYGTRQGDREITLDEEAIVNELKEEKATLTLIALSELNKEQAERFLVKIASALITALPRILVTGKEKK